MSDPGYCKDYITDIKKYLETAEKCSCSIHLCAECEAYWYYVELHLEDRNCPDTNCPLW